MLQMNLPYNLALTTIKKSINFIQRMIENNTSKKMKHKYAHHLKSLQVRFHGILRRPLHCNRANMISRNYENL